MTLMVRRGKGVLMGITTSSILFCSLGTITFSMFLGLAYKRTSE